MSGILLSASPDPGQSRAADHRTAGRYLRAVIADGTLSLRWRRASSPEIREAGCAVKVNGEWIYSSDYPSVSTRRCRPGSSENSGGEFSLTFSGLKNRPSLTWHIKIPAASPWVTLRLTVHSPEDAPPAVISGFKLICSRGGESGGPLSLPRSDRYRVLSESFSNTRESSRTLLLSSKRPEIVSCWLQMLRGPGDGMSFGAACLEARRYITLIKLSLPPSSADDNSPLRPLDWSIVQARTPGEGDGSIPDFHAELAAGSSISSDRVMIGAGRDWSDLLEGYAEIFQAFNQINLPPSAPMGFCSWTAFYRTVTEDRILAAARFVRQHLSSAGYRFIQVDGIGWPAARGDYLFSNRENFPGGIFRLGNRITNLGLTFGLWLGAFEVSEHSSVYQRHRDWLVGDNSGRPVEGRDLAGDRGYILDSTNPAARRYLAGEVAALKREARCRYFKLDFLGAAVVPGARFRKGVSPIAALRSGLKLIREAAGEDACLVAAEAPPWAVAGLVDACRAGPDIAHDWALIKKSAAAIACRYYLHRRLFLLDPDAVVVSRTGRPAGVLGRKEPARPLTLDQARVSFTVAALTGGILQLGDDLPSLAEQPERLALITNRELIGINRRGRGARPIDLMDYDSEFEIPAFWHIQEKGGSGILAVFNWEDTPRRFSIEARQLGLLSRRDYLLRDLWSPERPITRFRGEINTGLLSPHSVRVWRISPREIEVSRGSAGRRFRSR